MINSEERAALSERVACAEFAMSFALRQGWTHALAMQLANAILNRKNPEGDQK
jgi:hypothetical protein